MSNLSEKTASNVFYQARCRASAYNDQLSSREGAADLMCIDRGRLYRIEHGVANPYSEEVHLMADMYNAPELRNYFCTEMCPVGECYEKAQITDLDRIAVMAVSSLEKSEDTKRKLLKIVEDGKVSKEEKAGMLEVVEKLGELESVTQNLKNWVRRNVVEIS